MPTLFDCASAALMPITGLGALAAVRCHAKVTVVLSDDRAWVNWPPGDSEVWQRLLAVGGATFFEQRDGVWYQLGHRLPAFDVPPPGDARPLDRVLLPAPQQAQGAPSLGVEPLPLRLVPCHQVHATTALRTTIDAIQAWVDRATTRELGAVRAARCGESIMLRGERLPLIATAERFWGGRVLTPLGMRVEPDLPETVIRASAMVSLNEVLVITEGGAEAVPEEAFTPLTRARARLASLQNSPPGAAKSE